MRSPILLSHHPFCLGETLPKASPSVSQSPLGLSFMPMNSVPTELCRESTWSPLGKGCPAQDLCPWAPKSALPMLHIRAASPPPPPPRTWSQPGSLQKYRNGKYAAHFRTRLGWIPFHCCHLFPLRCLSPAPARVLAPKMFYSRIFFWSLLPCTAAHLRTPGGPHVPILSSSPARTSLL